MFRFLFPSFLIGLSAASIPIIIHLINRRKAITHQFSAIELVLRSHRRVARRFKLKQLLLLIIRSAIIACLSLAFAKPFYTIFGAMDEGSVVPSSNIILLDFSMSMRYHTSSNGDVSLFEKAKEEARQLIAQMKGADEALVIFCSGNLKRNGPRLVNDASTLSILPIRSSLGLSEFTNDKDRLYRVIDKVGREASFDTTDVLTYLMGASELLAHASNPIKQIFFITDMTRKGWESSEKFSELRARIRRSGCSVRVIDVSEGETMKNVAVSDVTVQQASGSDRDITVRAKVRNFSDDDCQNLLCEVFIEAKPVAKGFVSIKPNSSASKEFSCHLPKGGVLFGYVQIKGDRLPADDKRYFLVKSAPDVSALVVDGDPRTISHEAETFYLEKALNPALPRANVSSRIKPTIVTTSEFDSSSSGKLEDFDVVFLCNVEALSSQQASRLRGYVQRGGGLFISVGDNVDAYRYRKVFGNLLPQELKEVRSERREAQSLHLEDFGLKHPILEIFNEPRSADEGSVKFNKVHLSSASFFKTFLLRPASRGEHSTILKYDDGSPALVEKPFGRGKIMLFTSTIDRDWNDFPIQTTFLPLIQQITRYLSRTLIEPYEPPLLVGQPKELLVGEGASLVKVVDPRGVTITASNFTKSVKGTSGRKKIIFSQTNRPGIYRTIMRTSRPAMETRHEPSDYFEKYFVVNLDTRESDLAKISESEVMDILGREDNTNVDVIESGVQAQRSINEQRRNLWGYLLFAVLVWLTLESFVAWTM